ncbi:MAG: D-aminoacyl-tRNA deacylase [archaeon]
MKFAIIVSKKDLAGINIKNNLLELYKFSKKNNHYEFDKNISLHITEKDSIYCEDIDKEIEADVFIFATRHKSEKGTPSLSVHIPGNWGKAEYGGKDCTLCVAPASLLKAMFIELNEQGKHLDHEITLEAVHHGPLIKKPIMFIEIGSSEKEWVKKDLGKIIATTIMQTLTRPIKKQKAVFAIGGGHYPRTFNKFLLKTEYAIGQICQKYMLEQLNEDLLNQAMTKCTEKVELVVLDKKGLGQYKQQVINLLKKKKIKII